MALTTSCKTFQFSKTAWLSWKLAQTTFRFFHLLSPTSLKNLPSKTPKLILLQRHWRRKKLYKFDTRREELRGFAVDHTQAADRGPLSPTLTSKLPPISVSSQEAVLVHFFVLLDTELESFNVSYSHFSCLLYKNITIVNDVLGVSEWRYNQCAKKIFW